MGTNCAPLLADLFLYSYVAEFIQTLIKSGKRQLAESFNFTFRYIDDVLSLIIACCPWLPLLRGGLCRSTEYS